MNKLLKAIGKSIFIVGVLFLSFVFIHFLLAINPSSYIVAGLAFISLVFVVWMAYD